MNGGGNKKGEFSPELWFSFPYEFSEAAERTTVPGTYSFIFIKKQAYIVHLLHSTLGTQT